MTKTKTQIPYRAATAAALVAIFLASGWVLAQEHEAGLPKGIVEIGALQPVVSQ